MKLRLTFVFIVIIFCMAAAASAQTKSEAQFVPKQIMSADFQPVNASSAINLSAGKGKVTVLVLWASWCLPCRSAVVDINELKKSYSSRGVEVIGLTIDDPITEFNDVQTFLEDTKVDFRMGWLDAENGKLLLAEPAVVPQILVISEGGFISNRFMGWQASKTPRRLRKAVKEALARPPVRQ